MRLARLFLVTLSWVVATAQAQGFDPAALQQAEREALAPLAAFDGEWRGTARTLLPNGQWRELTQTERVGPMLDGTLRVVEGRGYDAQGALRFNALGIISYRPMEKRHAFHSYAMGFEGDHEMQLIPDGFIWSVQAGPQARLRYTLRIVDGRWQEVGERLVEGQPPQRTFEMTLDRIGPTTWPAAGFVPPR